MTSMRYTCKIRFANLHPGSPNSRRLYGLRRRVEVLALLTWYNFWGFNWFRDRITRTDKNIYDVVLTVSRGD